MQVVLQLRRGLKERLSARVGRVFIVSGLVGVFLFSGCIRRKDMEQLYAQRCFSCHGPAGKGDGPIAASLPVPIPDFRETIKNLRVYEIRRVIRNGKGVMPAYGLALSKAEIQSMVRFVRILSQEGREVEWWENLEPLLWAHCSVPWEYALGYDRRRRSTQPQPKRK